jgi:photosystem II stability/assembly factor-like uncharacterized protein
MKTITLIFSLSLVLTMNSPGQEWINVNPVFERPGEYNTFDGIFVDERNGWWIAGPEGYLWHTSNGGELWKSQIDSSDISGNNIVFTDTLHGWIIGRKHPGNQYYIQITKDGGKSWDRHPTPDPGLLCITMFDSLNGFAGGATIYSTADGGITWQPKQVDEVINPGITDIYFVDKKIGWAVGLSSEFLDLGVILNTTDGGEYWKVNQHPSGVSGLSVFFTDSLHGYVAGSNPPFFNGVIEVTNDGGNSWTTHYLPGTWLNDIVFTNDSTGWAVGNNGFIWHTTDMGLNWIQVESGTTSDLRRIFFFNNGKTGYIMGSNSTLLKYESVVNVQENNTYPPVDFKLFQNYPNPFNPSTQIKYTLPEREHVVLKVYDMLGREIYELVNEVRESGEHSALLNGSNLASGMYIVNIQAGEFNKSMKILLVK